MVLSVMKLKLIPPLNNFFVIFSYIIFLAVIIFIIAKVASIPTTKIKTQIKALIIVFSVIAFGLFSFYYFLISVFSYMDYQTFEYNNKKYYVINEGFLEPIYNIYEDQKNGKVKEIKTYRMENFPEKIDDRNKKAIVDGTLENLLKSEKALENAEKEKIQKELANIYKPENIKKVQGTEFELVDRQKSNANNRYLFIKNANGEKTVLSQIPTTADFDRASVTAAGDIYLYFKDSDGKIHTYRSKNSGMTWSSLN